ncbi:hypothetical protein ABIB57_003635 [Devosia sp. UYZn731]|uniref:DUF3168 domain-containing protein n=1 Tax=Devosia sp. UYZn731 TaxID=3156345 RepID=UPI0033984B3F
MDASLELLTAAIVLLKADAAVAALVADRIYDRVPERQEGGPAVPFPYISVGPSTSVPDDFDCVDGEEITVQFDIWTNGPDEAYGSTQCRKISGAVKKALHDVDLPLAVNALVSLQCEMVRIIDDPNPAISHGVVQFTATVEIA